MKLLDRYIAREVLTPTLIALLTLTFVMVGRQLSSLLELIVRQSATFDEIRALAGAIVPSALVFTIPMSLLVGVLTAFGRMSSDSEGIAFRAAGISMARILRPVLALGVLFWALNLILAVWVAPAAVARLRELTYNFAIRQLPLELQPRVFNEDVGDLVLYVQDASVDGRDWRGVFLADRRSPDEIRVTFAQAGQFAGDPSGSRYEVALSNGSTHTVSPLEPGRYSQTRFGTLTLPIPVPEPPAAAPSPAPEETSTARLWTSIRAGEAAFAEAVEFHRRLALPFACLVFVLIGLPLGLSTRRGGRSVGLVVSVLLMLVYYMLFIGGTRIAGNAQLSPFFGAWGANLAFLVLGAVLLVRSERDRRNVLPADLAELAARLRPRRSLRPEPGAERWLHAFTSHPTLFRTLDLYLLKRFVFFFTLILVVFVSLFIIVTLFELLPDIVKHNVGAGVVAGYFLYLLPQILYWIVPLAVLVGVLIVLGTLTKTNETLAVRAGAISLYRLSLPLLLTAGFLSLGVYFMQDYVLPRTNQRQDALRATIKGAAPQTFSDPTRQWMAGASDRIYFFNHFDANQNTFGGLSVFTLDPATFSLAEWTYAAQARWEGRWVLENGWTRAVGGAPDRYGDFARLEYPGMTEPPDYFKREVRIASQMNYPELERYIENLRRGGFEVNALLVDLHRKVSFPLVSVIMALIAIPFSFATGRRGAFYGIGFSIVIGIGYWGAFEIFDKLGGINQLSPLIAAWFPNLIFGFSGFWMLLKVRT